MNNKKNIIPKLNVDVIHREMKHHFKGFKYFNIINNKVNKEIYVMSNMERNVAIEVLEVLLFQMKNKSTIETNVDSKDLTKLN